MLLSSIIFWITFLQLNYAFDPVITRFPNQNNVWGRAQYKADTDIVKYLGSYNYTLECQAKCLSYRHPGDPYIRCQSFTHHQANLIDPDPTSFRTLCYAIIDGSWEPHLEKNVTSGQVFWGCTNDEDCSLNGRCHSVSGKCNCLAAWSGDHCDILNLEPAVKGAGLHAPGGPDSSKSSWGGTVAYDQESKRWIMFAAEMTNGCGINAWETNSRIVLASSETPGGAYRVNSQIKPTFAHEPVLARLADGCWLLYSIGNTSSSDPPRADCKDGYTPKQGGGHFKGSVPVEIYVSKKLSEGWTKIDHPIGEGDINPAPFVFPNGTTVMMWRGGDAWYHVHLSQAKNWNGVYSYNGTGTIFPGLDAHGIEDPFIYFQPFANDPDSDTEVMGTYHAIFHDHSTFGGHAFSRDGVSWTYSSTVPFTNKVLYNDGTKVMLERRERPHFIFDSRGFITHITHGVQPPPSESKKPPSSNFANDYTYTLIQPVTPQP